jgi:hypothetical protein
MAPPPPAPHAACRPTPRTQLPAVLTLLALQVHKYKKLTQLAAQAMRATPPQRLRLLTLPVRKYKY